jgi:hypothetical protein
MKDYLTLTFGLIISSLVPGAILAWGLFPYLSIFEPPWAAGGLEKTGEFLSVFCIVLATCGCGALAGGIRAITIDRYRRRRLIKSRFGNSMVHLRDVDIKVAQKDLKLRVLNKVIRFIDGAPQIPAVDDFSSSVQKPLPQFLDLSPLGKSSDKLKGYEVLVEEYMRLYNFFGNLVVVLPISFLLRLDIQFCSPFILSCLKTFSTRIGLVWMAIWMISWTCSKLYWRFFRTAAAEILYEWYSVNTAKILVPK